MCNGEGEIYEDSPNFHGERFFVQMNLINFWKQLMTRKLYNISIKTQSFRKTEKTIALNSWNKMFSFNLNTPSDKKGRRKRYAHYAM